MGLDAYWDVGGRRAVGSGPFFLCETFRRPRNVDIGLEGYIE